MKPLYRKSLGALVLVAGCAIWLISSSLWVRSRRMRTCTGKETLDVRVLDSAERRFVATEDVASWLEKEYRAYAGMQLDSVDLARIETIILSHSAVRDCQAWLTDDGSLHVALNQRQPVIRFQDGQKGYYADASGFLFPLQERFPVRVPVVDGDIPLTLTPGFKGFPQSDEELEWLLRMIALATQMKGFWNGKISQINVAPDGELMLIPRGGDECFRFGSPTGIDEKFERLRLYYEYIAPSRESAYKNVDLRFDGQIVCR